MSYACSSLSSSEAASLINHPAVPKPLLNNLGIEGTYLLDVALLATMNGIERTAEQFISLTKSAGFKIDRCVLISLFILLPSPPNILTQNILVFSLGLWGREENSITLSVHL